MTQAAFLLFVFLKQFYIKSSGSIGIADLYSFLRDISCFRYSTRKEKNAFGDRLEKRKILNCISDLRSNYKSVFYY